METFPEKHVGDPLATILETRSAWAEAGAGFWRICATRMETIYWCDGMFRLFGIEPSDTPPTAGSIFHRYHPDDRNVIAKAFVRLAKSGGPVTSRYRVITPAGECRHLLSRAWRAHHPLHGPVIEGVELDVTNAFDDQQLMESERHYRFVAENTRELIVRFSGMGVIEFASRASRRILGYEPEEMVGRRAEDFITLEHNMSPEQIRAAIMARRSGPSVAVEYCGRRKDGSTVWLEGVPKPVFDADGNLVSVVDVIRDVNELKAAEAEVEAQRAARLQAEAANRAKTAFVSTMSHELRTPLNGILGYAQLLLDDLDVDTPAHDDVRRIERSAMHLLSIVNQVLDLGRVEADRLDVRIEPVAVAEIFDEVRETIAPIAAANGVALSFDPGAAGLVATDRQLFKQALMNIATNACKFTKDGAVDVVARRETTAQGAMFAVDIRDEGIGIAPDAVSRLFQPFVQLDDSPTRRFGGTGLGLVLSRRFAQTLGGDVSVESAPGRGSTFTLRVRDHAMAAAASDCAA